MHTLDEAFDEIIRCNFANEEPERWAVELVENYGKHTEDAEPAPHQLKSLH